MKLPALKRLICYGFILIIASAGVQAKTYAAIVDTDQIATETTVESQREALKSLFAEDEVKQQLIALGVDPVDASERVDALSAAEVSELHGQVGDLPAGGVLGTIAVVLLILILLDVAGVTDIFPGV